MNAKLGLKLQVRALGILGLWSPGHYRLSALVPSCGLFVGVTLFYFDSPGCSQYFSLYPHASAPRPYQQRVLYEMSPDSASDRIRLASHTSHSADAVRKRVNGGIQY